MPRVLSALRTSICTRPGSTAGGCAGFVHRVGIGDDCKFAPAYPVLVHRSQWLALFLNTVFLTRFFFFGKWSFFKKTVFNQSVGNNLCFTVRCGITEFSIQRLRQFDSRRRDSDAEKSGIPCGRVENKSREQCRAMRRG